MKHLFSALAAAALLAVGGCATMDHSAAAPAADEIGETPGIKIGNALLQAIEANDYNAFIAAYGDADTKMTKEEFNASRENVEKQFGPLKSFTFLAELKMPLVRTFIWVAAFERKSSDGKEVIVQELLFRLITGEVDGKIRILGMGFL